MSTELLVKHVSYNHSAQVQCADLIFTQATAFLIAYHQVLSSFWTEPASSPIPRGPPLCPTLLPLLISPAIPCL